MFRLVHCVSHGAATHKKSVSELKEKVAADLLI